MTVFNNNTLYPRPELYDHKLGFVSELGKGVVELLNPGVGERILDLGCGTGDLSHVIAQSGAIVVGIDRSEEMIEQARRKYPALQFEVGDAEHFSFSDPFDAVLSNAVLHWAKQAEKVIRCVRDVLNNGGRFVAEFGGKGNVKRIISAI